MATGGSCHLACATCHTRKQRCDMPEGGGTCFNCRALNVECRARERKARARKRDSRNSPEVGDSSIPNRNKRSRDCSPRLSASADNDSQPIADADKFVYVGLREYGNQELNVAAPDPTNLNTNASSLSLSTRVHDTYLRSVEAFELPHRSIRDALLASFLERVLPWYPVLTSQEIDKLKRFETPHVLNNAVLLAGTMVSTACGRQELAEKLLLRVSGLLHTGPDQSPMTLIKAFLFLSWSNKHISGLVSMDGDNLWHSQMVALAYQHGLHREPLRFDPNQKMRRKVWHAVLARDCICSATSGRPRYISTKDSDVKSLYNETFVANDDNPQFFMHHVELCLILGDIAQHKMRGTLGKALRTTFGERMLHWSTHLPRELQIYDLSSQTLCEYNRQNLQLHVNYLTCILMLFITENKRIAPLPTSILAAGLVSGIFEEMMARGDVQLMPGFFAFSLLTSGYTLVYSRERQSLWAHLESSFMTIRQALGEIACRYTAASVCKEWITRMLEKAQSFPAQQGMPDMELPFDNRALFANYGPDLCSFWDLIFQSPSHRYETPVSVQTKESSHHEDNSPMQNTITQSDNMDAFGGGSGLWEFDRQQAESFMGDWLFNDTTTLDDFPS